MWKRQLEKVTIIVTENSPKNPNAVKVDFLWSSVDQVFVTKCSVWDDALIKFSPQVKEYNGKYYQWMRWESLKVTEYNSSPSIPEEVFGS